MIPFALTHGSQFRALNSPPLFGTGEYEQQCRDLIVLNNVFWSTNYDDRCNPDGGDPGAAELAWLDWTLYRTKLRGRSASLLFHIPPGIDSFNAAHRKGACQANVTPYFKEAYAEGFLALLEEYREILGNSYSGHTHMDNFRLVATAAGEPILLTHITPAVSPIYQNNPAFALVLYDRASGVWTTSLPRMLKAQATFCGSVTSRVSARSFVISARRSLLLP